MFLTQNLMRNQNLKEKIQNIFLEKSYEQILKYADNVDFQENLGSCTKIALAHSFLGQFT